MTQENLSAISWPVNHKITNQSSEPPQNSVHAGEARRGRRAQNSASGLLDFSLGECKVGGVESEPAPPCNTGLIGQGSEESAKSSSNLRMDTGIDYLIVSIPGLTKCWLDSSEGSKGLRDKVADFCGEDRTQERVFKGGYHGYAVAGGTERMSQFSTRPKMGSVDDVDVLIVLTGQGIAFMNSKGVSDLEILRFCKGLITSHGGRFTRVDVCLDVFWESVSPASLYAVICEDRYGSRARGKQSKDGQWKDRHKFHGNDGKINTFEFGRRDGSRFFRCYNKTLEQEFKWVGDVPEDWTRLELQLGKDEDAADKAVDLVLEMGWAAVPGMINDFVWLKESAEWDAIFSGKVTLNLKGRTATTIEKKVNWVLAKSSGVLRNVAITIKALGISKVVQLLREHAESFSDDVIHQICTLSKSREFEPWPI